MDHLLFALLGLALVMFIIFGVRYWYVPALQLLLAICAVLYMPIAVIEWLTSRRQANASREPEAPSAEPPPVDLGPWHAADKRARELWAKGSRRRKERLPGHRGVVVRVLACKHSTDGRTVSTTAGQRYLTTLRAEFSRAMGANELGVTTRSGMAWRTYCGPWGARVA
jgi:hypothetical protein